MASVASTVRSRADLSSLSEDAHAKLWNFIETMRPRLDSRAGSRALSWLGDTSVLEMFLAGSVVIDDDGKWETIPLSRPGLPAVKETTGDVLVRLTTVATLPSERYVPLHTLMQSSKWLWPGVLTFDAGAGFAAERIRLAEGGAQVRLIASATASGPLLKVLDDRNNALSAATTIDTLGSLSTEWLPMLWVDVAKTGPWGRPPFGDPPTPRSKGLPTSAEVTRALSEWNIQLSGDAGEGLNSAEAATLLSAWLGFPKTILSATFLAHAWTDDSASDIRTYASQLLSAVVLLFKDFGTEALTKTLRGLQGRPDVPAENQFHLLGLAFRSAQHEWFPPELLLSSTSNTPIELPVNDLSTTSSSSSSALVSSRVRARSRPSSPAREGATLFSVRPQRPHSVTSFAELPGFCSLSQLPSRASIGSSSQQTAIISLPNEGAELVDRGPKRPRQGFTPTAHLDISSHQQSQQQSIIASTHSSTSRSTASNEQQLQQSTEDNPTPPPGGDNGDCMARRVASGAYTTRFLLPPEGFNLSPAHWLSALAGGGASSLAKTVSNALHRDSDQVFVPAGSALEAELFLVDLESMELRLHQLELYPFNDSAQPPQDWSQAARNAITFMTATVRATRSLLTSTPTQTAGPTLEPKTTLKEKPPLDSFQPIEVASRTVDVTLAVDPTIIDTLTTIGALRAEHIRDSPFKSLTSSTAEERNGALAGELSHFIASYGQAATAYLVSNGMALSKPRGAGVPTALAGIRAHLFNRASAIVGSHFGAERAQNMHADANKLALSMLTGSFVGDSPSSSCEQIIVSLLGGSKPHLRAEVDDEGGSITAGTLGTLLGVEGQWSVRAAYPRWARGLARVMGPILSARNLVDQVDQPLSSAIGDEGDFGVEDALQKIPHNLPVESLRSICRYLTSELSRATHRHRREPGAPLPDVVKMAKTMGEDVFSRRFQDYRFSVQVEAKHASLFERLKQLEARTMSPSDSRTNDRGATAGSSFAVGPSKRSRSGKIKARFERSTGTASSTSVSRDRSSANAPTGANDDHPAPVAGATPSTQKDKQPSQHRTNNPDDSGPIPSRLEAVKALQQAVRARLNLPLNRDNAEKEPCAWRALVGNCKRSACKSCGGQIPMPEDLLAKIRSRCKPGALNPPNNTP